jgi:hypothetical protein
LARPAGRGGWRGDANPKAQAEYRRQRERQVFPKLADGGFSFLGRGRQHGHQETADLDASAAGTRMSEAETRVWHRQMQE